LSDLEQALAEDSIENNYNPGKQQSKVDMIKSSVTFIKVPPIN